MKNRTPARPAVPDFTPVPRKYRHDGWTPERQRAFLDALADTGSVKHAAHRINMSPEGAYYLRRQPGAEEFAAAWQAALDHGVQRLEDIAMDRALNGVEVPVYSYGKLVGSRTVHNDRLLMFLLRNRATDRFGDAARGKALTRSFADEERPDSASVIERVRKAMAEVKERLLNDPEQQEYLRWQEAKRDGRAIVLPKTEGHGAAESEGHSESDDLPPW
jgi:hypothetical protein